MLSLTATARPAETAASPNGKRRPSAERSRATAASTKNTPTTSLAALPAWEMSTAGTAIASAVAVNDSAPTPRGRPMQ